MKLFRRICACIFVVVLTTGFCAMAAESGNAQTPRQQTAAESSAFIDLQLENISNDSGRGAAQEMLLGTLTSISGREPTPVLEQPRSADGLQFSPVSVTAFAVVLAGVCVFGWYFFRARRREAENGSF